MPGGTWTVGDGERWRFCVVKIFSRNRSTASAIPLKQCTTEGESVTPSTSVIGAGSELPGVGGAGGGGIDVAGNDDGVTGFVGTWADGVGELGAGAAGAGVV